MYPKLSNDPIHQSVIEFRFLPTIKEESGIGIKNELWREIQEDYPIMEEQKQAQIEFKIGQNSPPPRMIDLGTNLLCKSKDESLSVIIANNRISLTGSKKYLGWDVFSEAALDIWTKIQNKKDISSVTRLGVRFINHLQMPLEPFDIDEYLQNGPRVPANTPEYIAKFEHYTTLENPNIKCLANYIQSFQPSKKPITIIDIDVYTANPLEPIEEKIRKKLNEIRQYKNDIFFGSLTEKSIDSLK